MTVIAGACRAWAGLRRDVAGAAALETALVLLPFLLLLFCTIQVAVFFVSQAALDTAVLRTAENLRAGMVAGEAYVPPTAAGLKSTIAANGSLPTGAGDLAVEIRPLTSLMGPLVTISDGTVDVGAPGSMLVIRARVPVLNLARGLPALTASSAAIVRRPAF